MLEARGLVVAAPGHAGTAPAAGPLDLTLAPGERVGLVGANGAGKTALVHTLAGLAPRLAGTLTIDGLDPARDDDARAARRLVGVVFQEPETQFITDRVTREIAFPLENLGWSRRDVDARVDELVRAFELGALADAPPERLSGGEMQRVALAAAVAPRPRYLLLDEPASFLDPTGRALLARFAEAAAEREGMALLWSECERESLGKVSRVLDLPLRSGVPRPVVAGPTPPSVPATGALWKVEQASLELTDARGRTRLWGGTSFTIGRGERWTIGGANGSGKTSLLETLAGWRAPSSGTWEGPSPGDLGVVGQFPEFQLFAATALEDVAFGPRHRARAGGEEAVRRAQHALERVGLDPERCAVESPSSFSLGERRRLALAGALAAQPVALLLDEPAAGLDRAGREDLERILETLVEGGTTVVVATHETHFSGRRIDLPEPLRQPFVQA